MPIHLEPLWYHKHCWESWNISAIYQSVLVYSSNILTSQSSSISWFVSMKTAGKSFWKYIYKIFFLIYNSLFIKYFELKIVLEELIHCTCQSIFGFFCCIPSDSYLVFRKSIKGKLQRYIVPKIFTENTFQLDQNHFEPNK